MRAGASPDSDSPAVSADCSRGAGVSSSRSWKRRLAAIPPAVWAISILVVAALLLTTARYGIFRDELYYLACADHLAWGYVDHPPLSIAILAAWTALFGDSALSLGILPALGAGLLVLMTSDLAGALGGDDRARTLAALAIGVAPIVLILGGFYSMNILDLIFWVGLIRIVVWILNRGEPRGWLAFGLLGGLGLLNKLGVLFLLAAIALSVVLTPLRRHLRTPWPWTGAGLALLLVLPHLVWQLRHGWPTLEFMANARLYKIAYHGPLAFIGEAALMVGPPSLLVWLPGLAWLLLRGAGGRYRAVGLSLLGILLFLAFQPSKAYYASPIFLVLFAAGAVALSRWQRAGRWLVPAIGTLLVGAALVTAPLFLPLLPPEDLAAYGQRLGFVPAGGERHGPTVLPQYFADRFGWEEMAVGVARAWESIPPEERDSTLLLTSNYGEAGALRYYADRYDLPPAASQHNNFFLWGPDKDLGSVTTVLAVGIDPGDLEDAFREVHLAGEVDNPFAMPYETGPILWLARHPKVDLKEGWRRGKSYI